MSGLECLRRESVAYVIICCRYLIARRAFRRASRRRFCTTSSLRLELGFILVNVGVDGGVGGIIIVFVVGKAGDGNVFVEGFTFVNCGHLKKKFTAP